MTSSSTAISVSNQSLLRIGARATIASFSEGSTEADACNILYTPTFEMLARTANWNCLRQQAVLSLIAAAEGTPENPDGTTLPLPPNPWLYSYSVPANSLQIRYLIPTFPNATPSGQAPMTTVSNMAGAWVPGDGQIPFQVAYATDEANNPQQVILTNLSQAQAVYTVNQPNPLIWDSLFEQAFVSSLAAFLVPALSLNLPLMQAAARTADAIIAQARIRDGDEGVTSVDHIPDWMRARNAGASLGWNNTGYAAGLYAMTWPGAW